MNWGSLSEFLAMKGYGLYVWGSYGVTAALMLIEPWLARRHRQASLRDVATTSAEDRT